MTLHPTAELQDFTRVDHCLRTFNSKQIGAEKQEMTYIKIYMNTKIPKVESRVAAQASTRQKLSTR